MGTEDIRILPAQGVFVPRITHDSRGNRIIPLLGAGQSYDTGVFMVRGYNKIDIIARSNVNADIFVYMGPDPAQLAAMTPGDNREKARLPYAELAVPNGDFPPEQYSVQVSGDFARVIFRNNTAEAQTVWDFQVNLKPIGEGQCFREYIDGAVNPLGIPIYRYLTMTSDHRLRVDVSGGGGGALPVSGEKEQLVWLANNSSANAGNTIPADPNTGSFSIDSAGTLTELDGSIKEFTIYAEILSSGAGSGDIVIEGRSIHNVVPWVEFDRFPLAAGQRLFKTFKAQANAYRVYFDNTGGVLVTGFYGNVYLKPQT